MERDGKQGEYRLKGRGTEDIRARIRLGTKRRESKI